MSRLCPGPCSRLATAVVLIAVGVVQFLVGIILLRSKYADLISGPNFMTASTNIGVGCVFGITASIWKNSRKPGSRKHTARRNVLASLLVSVITVNITSAVILIMGEGNRHLSVYLGKGVRNSLVAFANEILAGAYIASICSPFICIVVAIIALSGNWFQMYDGGNKVLGNSVSKAKRPAEPSRQSRPNTISDAIEISAAASDVSSSSSEDSVFSEKALQTEFLSRKSILANRTVQSPLKTWSQKRDKILTLSCSDNRTFSFDNCLQNLNFNYVSNDVSAPHAKNSFSRNQSETKSADSNDMSRCLQDAETSEDVLFNKASGKLVVDEFDFKRCHEAYRDTISRAMKKRRKPGRCEKSERSVNSKSKDCNALCRENICSKQLGKQNSISVTDAIDSRASVSVASNKQSSDSTTICQKTNLNVDHAVTKLQVQTLKERVKLFSPRELKSTDVNTNELNCLFKVTKLEPGQSTELVLISKADTCLASQPEENSNVFENVRENNLTNSRKCTRIKNDKKIELPCIPFSEAYSPKPAAICKNKVITVKLPNKKSHPTIRMSSMESITEMPSEEMNENTGFYKDTLKQISDVKGPAESHGSFDENSNITHNTSTPDREKASESSSSYRKSSTSISPKNLLRKVWSPSPEIKFDISNLIVDEDSLIGLNEEELIARTSRIRSLRKTVMERLKTEIRTGSLGNATEG